LEDYNSAGSWTPTSTNNSDEIILGGSGAIISAAQVGQYIAVWTTTSLYLGQFIGDPSQAYRFDKVEDVTRPMSARSVAIAGAVVYWMGFDFQLRAWTPGALSQVIPCPISRDFIDNCTGGAALQTSAYLASNSAGGEVWFFYDDGREIDGYISRYIAYSINESAMAQRPVWFRGQLARSAMLDSEIVRPMAGTGSQSVLSTDASGVVYLEGDRTSALSGAYIQSADQYIDNSQQRMMIQRCVPDFEDVADDSGVNMSLTVYVRNYPQADAVAKGPYSLLHTTKKADFRASGKVVAFKLASNLNIAWRLGKFMFDTVPMGER
jgi:hypothetical protein